jgi:predicted transcriptional regulator
MAETTSAATTGGQEMLNLASTIIAAYVSRNSVPVAELPAMIKNVHSTLCGLAGAPGGDGATAQKPAVPIKKSITADYVICLEDGKKLKMLKRYLRSNFNMTPDEYRTKWGLPRDYPMVAPNYAAKRSEFAKKIGLGRSKSHAAPKRRKRA